MGFNYLKAKEPLLGDSLLFITKFPEIPGTHLINLRRIKAELILKPPSGFELLHQPSYYQIEIKVKICKIDSILTMNSVKVSYQSYLAGLS